jgi:large conductance mechanosensitive channel
MLKEFKAFIMKGNLVDLAVAFVLGLAFATVVTAFTDNIVGPIIGLVVGKSSLGALSFTLGSATIRYGAFLDAVVTFVLTGFVLFLIVKAYNRFRATADLTTKTCEFCKTQIALGAVRCPNCTSQLQTT